MWMLSVSCSLVSIYCYNLHLFSCVLSLLNHNCCSECLYNLLHHVILKINYQSDVLLSNSRIIITVLFDIEFNIARAHTVWSLLSCLWSMLCGTSLLLTPPPKVLILFAVLSFNKYKLFIFHQL